MKVSSFAQLAALAVSFAPALAEDEVAKEVSKHIEESTTANLLKTDVVSISCKECSIVGDISLSVGNDDHTPDSNFSSLPFKYEDERWLVAQVDNFKVRIELDFALTPKNDTNEISVPLLGEKGIDIPFEFKDVFDVTWNFNPTIHGWVNSSEPVNFVYGFEVEIPNDSAVYVSPELKGTPNVTSIGFDQTSLTPLNYTSTTPSAAFSFALSFRPILSLSASAFDSTHLALGVSAFVDAPQLSVNVSQVTHATEDCQPASSASDSGADDTFDGLTLVQPSVAYDFGFNYTLGERDEDDEDRAPSVWQVGERSELPQSCLMFDEGKGALVAPRKKGEENAASRGMGVGWGVMGALVGMGLGLVVM